MVLNILLQLTQVLTDSIFGRSTKIHAIETYFVAFSLQIFLPKPRVSEHTGPCDSAGQWCQLGLQGTSKEKGNGSLECGRFAAAFLWKVSGGTDVRKLWAVSEFK